jgi:S-adenosylmethionine/arginine decarboxylase-like enzyme
MNNKFWGYHLMLDCSACDIQSITNPGLIAAFSNELVARVQMIPYGQPQVVHFAEHDPSKAGWTLVQLIQTSNICGHFIDSTGDAYLDVFSCKTFDNQTVIDVVNRYFNPKNIKVTFITRDATPSNLT